MDELEKDVFLLCENAQLYNQEQSDVCVNSDVFLIGVCTLQRKKWLTVAGSDVYLSAQQ